MKWIVAFVMIGLTVIPSAAQPPAARVVVAKVFEKELAKTTPILGIVDFDQRSGISPEISGLIAAENLVEGNVVKKGAVITTLNTDFLRKDIKILEGQIQQIGIKIANTEKNLKRYATLFEGEATSEKVYEDLVDQSKELQVQQQILRLQMEKKQLEIDKSTIRAPFNGLVLEKHKNRGEWVSPGTAICTLASIENVYVRVAVSEGLIQFIQPNDTLALSIKSLQKEFQGTIEALVPVADLKSKTFAVKVAVPYTKGMIQNMSVTVNVPTGRKEMLRMVKRDALVRFQGKDFIFTVKEGKAVILPIQIAAIDGEYIGVNMPSIVPGMLVIVDGNDRLRNDQPVEIVDGQK